MEKGSQSPKKKKKLIPRINPGLGISIRNGIQVLDILIRTPLKVAREEALNQVESLGILWTSRK